MRILDKNHVLYPEQNSPVRTMGLPDHRKGRVDVFVQSGRGAALQEGLRIGQREIGVGYLRNRSGAIWRSVMQAHLYILFQRFTLDTEIRVAALKNSVSGR
ncbi:hypothetical protein [Roseinatronobacter thiooxidans]|uniref:hypothetical protein n=1 Tax=Roseinatronobacter thiooxidans TaxID=121821 RepID=UPI001FE0615F|nr:hypothetical protein [Roseinatronobacter thiooxidans]